MSYSLCRVTIKEQVNTGSAQSSVVPEQARIDEASADHLLIREVEEFVEMLMDWYVNTRVMHVLMVCFTTFSSVSFLVL